jgi:hypothetical protein
MSTTILHWLFISALIGSGILWIGFVITLIIGIFKDKKWDV